MERMLAETMTEGVVITAAASPAKGSPASPRSAKPEGSPSHKILSGSRLAQSLVTAAVDAAAELVPLASATEAEGGGLRSAVLKVPATFALTVRDTSGNVCGTVDDVPFKVVFRGPEMPVHRMALLPDGRFQVQWATSVTGKYTIDVLVRGEAIPGSPFSALAEYGRIDSLQCQVRDAMRRVTVGERLGFTIVARDQSGTVASYSPLAASGYRFTCVATAQTPGGGGDGGDGGAAADPLAAAAAIEVEGDVVDNRDGTSRVTLLFTTCGTYTVRVVGEDGGELDGSPFTASASAGGMDARFCELQGEGLYGGEAGKLATFRVQALDRHGNVCAEGAAAEAAQAARFSVLLLPIKRGRRRGGLGGKSSRQVRAPAPAPPDEALLAEEAGAVRGFVRALGNGLYCAEYAAGESGGYDLRVSHLGVALCGSPFRISVAPSATHVPSCMRLFVASHEEPLPQTTAGATTSFDIVARDQHHNARGVGGDWFTATLYGPETVHAEVLDRGDGTYTVRCCPRRSGDYLLAVTKDEQHIAGSRFALAVAPGATLSSACAAFGAGLQVGEAGEAQTFMLEARDADSNPRGVGGDHFSVAIVGPMAPRNREGAPARLVAAHPQMATVTDKRDGTYEVRYHIDLVGYYEVALTLRGEHVRGSPFELLIAGGATHPASSERRGADPTDRLLGPTLAGEAYSLVIQARDSFGNARNRGGDTVAASASGKHGFEGAAVDNGDGTYEVTLRPQRAGEFMVAVTINGEHIAGSRFALKVLPSDCDAASCVLAGSGLVQVGAGELARFTLQAWDAHGNVASPRPDAFRVVMRHAASPIELPVAIAALANGRFGLSYRATVAGTYRIDVLLREEKEKQRKGGRHSGGKADAAAPTADAPAAPPPGPPAAAAAAAAAATTKRRSSGVNGGAGAANNGGGGGAQPGWLQVGGSPFTVQVLPGATSARACAVRVESAAVLRAGEPVTVHVHARDGYFNERVSGGDAIELLLRPDGPPVARQPALEFGAVVDHGDGSYTATISRTVAARYELLVQLRPPPRADAADGGAPDADAEEGPDAPPEGAASPLKRQGTTAFQAVGSLARKQLQARAKARSEAAAAAAMARGGRVHIFASRVEIVPLASHAASCVVSGEGLRRATVLQPATFVVQPRDRYGNITRELASAFSASLERADAAAPADAHAIHADDADADDDAQPPERAISVGDGPGGAALGSYICMAPGAYRVHVLLRDRPLDGSPFACVVEASEMHPTARLARYAAAAAEFSGGALAWDADTAPLWEAHRTPRAEHVARGLGRGGGALEWGVETARTWALLGDDYHPHAYEQRRAAEEEGGVAGSLGRYAMRKRAALLHYKLHGLSVGLQGGGVGTAAAAGGGGWRVDGVGGGESMPVIVAHMTPAEAATAEAAAAAAKQAAKAAAAVAAARPAARSADSSPRVPSYAAPTGRKQGRALRAAAENAAVFAADAAAKAAAEHAAAAAGLTLASKQPQPPPESPRSAPSRRSSQKSHAARRNDAEQRPAPEAASPAPPAPARTPSVIATPRFEAPSSAVDKPKPSNASWRVLGPPVELPEDELRSTPVMLTPRAAALAHALEQSLQG